MTDKFGRTITISTSAGETTYTVGAGAVVEFTVKVPEGTPAENVLATIEPMEPSAE